MYIPNLVDCTKFCQMMEPELKNKPFMQVASNQGIKQVFISTQYYAQGNRCMKTFTNFSKYVYRNMSLLN